MGIWSRGEVGLKIGEGHRDGIGLPGFCDGCMVQEQGIDTASKCATYLESAIIFSGSFISISSLTQEEVHGI